MSPCSARDFLSARAIRGGREWRIRRAAPRATTCTKSLPPSGARAARTVRKRREKGEWGPRCPALLFVGRHARPSSRGGDFMVRCGPPETAEAPGGRRGALWVGAQAPRGGRGGNRAALSFGGSAGMEYEPYVPPSGWTIEDVIA
jgi:hypothetical protein